MLNDFFISRDVLGFVSEFLKIQGLSLPNFEKELEILKKRKHMSYEQWWALLDELDAQLSLPALGVAIGRHVNAEQCGVLGYLFKTSHNMAEALTCYSRFERLLYAGGKVETKSGENNTVTLAWNPEHGYSSLLSDSLLVSGMLSVGRGILSPRTLNPVAVCFTHSIDSDALQVYRDYFQCPVQTSQKQLAVTFNIADLLYPISHQDSVLHSLLGQQAQEQLNQQPEVDPFLISLHDTIIRCLHEGRADAKSVCDQMHISPRTLHRRLKAKNKIYRDVLRDIRISMAERYLKDQKLTLAEIALLLGYQDQSAFTRAFTGWFSCSPKQYKQKQNITV